MRASRLASGAPWPGPGAWLCDGGRKSPTPASRGESLAGAVQDALARQARSLAYFGVGMAQEGP
jgi:hypothetical protein